MKKSTKIIALVLALAAILAVLAVAVFAENGAENTPVEKTPGEYTKIPGSFDPTDAKWNGKYDGMTYGLWSNPRAFEAGVEPDYWYTGDLTRENVACTDENGVVYSNKYKDAGYIPSYVYVFADIKGQTAQLVTGDKQALTIDLQGHTLVLKNGIKIGGQSASHPNASFTVRNGKVIHSYGQMQFRSDTSFIAENVHWVMTNSYDGLTHNQSAMYYIAQADLIRYTDCLIELERAASFSLGYQTVATGAAKSELIFENTDIVYPEGMAVPVLFDITEGPYNTSKASWNISFDKNSSLTADSITGWFRYKEHAIKSGGTYSLWSNSSTLNIEPGFALSSGLTKPTTYQLIAVDLAATTSAGAVKYKSAEETHNIGEGTNFTVTEIAGAEEETTTVGTYTAPAGSWSPTEGENTGNYPGITFATWATEQDFLDGKAPIAWYQDLDKTAANYTLTFAADNICADGVGYVHCFYDVKNQSSARLATKNGTYLVINLAGHTLLDMSGWTINASSGPNPNSLFMVKNGTVSRPAGSSGATYCRQDGTIIFKNVIYDCSASSLGTVFEDIGCELFMFEDSIVKMGPNQRFAFTTNWKDPYKNIFIFKNSDLIQTGNPTTPLFRATQVENPARENNITIIFDKDSSVTRSNKNWIELICTNQKLKYTQGLYFEVGCQISPEAMPAYDMTYSYTDGSGTATKAANTNGGFLEVAVINPVAGGIQYTLPTASAIPTVSGTNAPIGREPGAFSSAAFMDKVKAELYCSKAGFELQDGEGSALKVIVALPIWKPGADMSYAVWESEEKFLEGVAPILTGTGSELLALDVATSDGVTFKPELGGKIPGYVVFYTNLEIKGTPLFIGNNQNIIFDLSGSTLLVNADIKVGNPEVENCTASLKLMGGTIELVGGVMTAAKETATTFDNMTVNVKADGRSAALFAARGSVTYKDSKLFLLGENAGFDLAGANVQFINTDLEQYGSKAPLFWIGTGDTASTVSFDKDCDIARDSSLYVGINAAITGGTLKLDFADGLSVAKDAVPDFTYLVSTAPTVSGSFVNTSASNSACDIAVVTPDATRYTDIYFVTADDRLKLLSTIENYAAAEIDPKNPRYFYQVWESVIDMGSNKTAFTTRNNAIIKLFRDAELKNGGTYSDYNLTFDLNGHKLNVTSSSTIQLGIDMSGSWKTRVITFTSTGNKGTLSFNGSANTYLQARPGTNVYFENLDIDYNSTYIFNDGGAELIYFKDCKITSTKGAGSYIASRDGIGADAATRLRYMVLDGSTTVKTGLTSIYATIIDKADYVVVIKGGSVIDNSVPLVTATDNRRVANSTLPEDNPGRYSPFPPSLITRPVFIDVDTKFTVGSTSFAKLGEQHAYKYHAYAFTYYDGISDYKNPGTPLPENKLLMLGEGDYFKISDETALDVSKVAYAYAFPGCIKIAVLKPEGEDPFITLDTVKSLEEGTVVTLYSDLIYKPTESNTSTHHKGGLVFDLSGNKLILSDTFTVYGSAFTLKNGTLTAPEALSGTMLVLDGAAVLTLDGVRVEKTDALDTVFAVGTGKLVLMGGTAVNAPSATLATVSDGAELELNTVNVESIASFAELTLGARGAKINMLAVQVNSTGAFLSGTTSAGLADVKLTGVVLACSELVSSADKLVSLVISESFFSSEPALDPAVGTISFARGERAMEVENLGVLTWRVTVFDVKMKASIFIESDFGIKFYLPTNTNVTKIVIAGTEYVVSDITDIEDYDGKTYKFILIEGIRPDEAAEVIDIRLVFNKDEISHIEDTGYCVTDYFKTLLNSDKTLRLKELGVATLDYIAAAYRATGRSNAELDALIASAQYGLYKPELLVPENTEDNTAAIAGAITGAQFELGSMVKFRFNLNSAYTGTVKINGREFAVENGVCEGKGYIAISLPAFEVSKNIIIEADGAIGTYSLEKYAAAIMAGGETETNKSLVLAFYNYCRYAEIYRAMYED